MLNEGSSTAPVCIASHREAACPCTHSLLDVSAEQCSKAQTFKFFKHTRNTIQLREGEHMLEPSTGQRMPPCPTVYALATLVFSQECLLCHVTTPSGIFQIFFLKYSNCFSQYQSNPLLVKFSVHPGLLRNPSCTFDSCPARGEKADGLQMQQPCCCLECTDLRGWA